MLVKITCVNATKGYQFSTFETEYDVETSGELYRELQEEYGRCTGKIHVDSKSRGTRDVGWVFEKRMQYDNTDQFYLREAWCSPIQRTFDYIDI